MTPERWQQIEALYHAVRARPVEARPAFLVEACRGDEALRREVESLLAQPVSAEGMLDRPAVDAVPMTSDIAGDGALAGRRLGAYLFQKRIGAGGMGEVYRAQDMKLRRDVAIKILPRAFTNDPDRLARFEREARLLASLNHPNIGAIYGLEELDPSNGSGQALVLELVEGETLAERIRRGPIPLAEALPIAGQIADALEAAHEQGIVHRDLKPANIKVRSDGTVKVLDFGLAKAMEPAAGSSPSVSQSPTLAPAMTEEGMILGTAAYMSPEQARGKAVDKRADVWAFGAVLFEMLTGQRAFRGATTPDTMAAILEREPEWNALPASTPVSIRRLLQRCLTKDPKRRLRDIGDAALDLAAPDPAERTAVARRPERRTWMAVTVLLVALVAALIPAVRYLGSVAPPAPDVRLEIPLPPGGAAPRISPDGRRVVYVAAASSGRLGLWVRSLNAVGAVMLPGTEGANYPFWSPDSRSIAFFVPAEQKLKKVEAAGGPPQALAHVAGNFREGTWPRDGTIVFSNTVLRQIAASGGDAIDLTELDKSLDETFHAWPSFLPDGRHFLYLAWSGRPENRAVYIGSLESKTRTRLMAAESRAIYAAPGFVLFGRGGALVARPFDPDRLEFTGDAVPIAEKFGLNPAGGAAFNASKDGTLVYRAGGALRTTRRWLWMDRTGKKSELIGATPPAGTLRLSPDGKRVAFSASSETAAGVQDIWIYDIDRGIRTRLTTDPSLNHWPVWSPDGSRLVFDSNRGKHGDFHALYETRANGATPERLLFEPEPGKGAGALDWSRDGRLIVFRRGLPNTDLWVLPLSGDRKPFPYLTTPFDEPEASLSPDGRWLAYTSNESGSYQVVVRSFPDPSGDRRQISTEGGAHPRWRGDGKEVYYLDPRGRIVAVAVKADRNLEVGKSTPLFDAGVPFPDPPFGPAYPFDIHSDGQRFLVSAPDNLSTSIIVVPNWAAGLKRQ